MQYQNSKPWQTKFGAVPSNYHMTNYIPSNMDMDLVLSHTRFGQYQTLTPIAQKFNLPVIQLEHTLPVPNWGNETRMQVKNMKGDINAFISEFSVEQWGFSLNDPSVRVIHHGVDTDLFRLSSEAVRQNRVLTVANDFINRDWCLNYTQFSEVTKGLEPTIVGDTPGLSKPSEGTDDLVKFYQTHRIYLNTAHVSPIPMSLLEAMSCGCAVVSCRSAAIPDYIVHGVNGILCDTTEEMKSAVLQLTNDEAMAKELGDNAAKTIKTKFNLDIFVQNWKNMIGELI
jgi:glycosyltransferase involved in cell wall biosynthesis